GGNRADEKAEGNVGTGFGLGSSCCSAPYIWGTVSVLLGFSWWITVSASLACFPPRLSFSASGPAPVHVPLHRGNYFLGYGAYCDRSIGLAVGVS
ncbi:hypothetical protein JTE90_012222, partial [Oedothorax gibbosus]